MRTEKTRQEVLDGLGGLFKTGGEMSASDGKMIFKAVHAGTGRDFLIKSLPEYLPVYGFLRGVECDGLPRVYEVYECPDGAVLIEEFIKGRLLSDLIMTEELSKKQAADIVISLCGILLLLHSNGFVHRDIKPENVMISGERVVLIDFDAARLYDDSKTGDTRVLGTPGYASPEQFGISQSDSRVDIYALGVLYNVLLTGCHPTERIAKGRAGRIILKCTQINPDLRYRSAEALASALGAGIRILPGK